MKKNILAASLAAAIAGGMVAQVEAISLAENDTGQVLLGPVYGASSADGITTKIAVANTRTDWAVKAKVVFRESIHSSEVLDFFIYLSPGDVWRGEVIGDFNAASIRSSDDSFTDGSTFASATNVLTYPFFDKENSGSNGYGHFEVIGAYAASLGTYSGGTLGASGASTNVKVTPGMSKSDLKRLFDIARPHTGITGGTISSIMPDAIQLHGTVDITVGTDRFGYNIPALGPTNYSTIDPTRGGGVSISTGELVAAAGCTATTCVSNYVVTNDQFDPGIATETQIGSGFGAVLGSWTGDIGDHTADIEWAMARTIIPYVYEHSGLESTYPLVSFVTKYRHRSGAGGIDVCGLRTGISQATISSVSAATANDGVVNTAIKEYYIPFQDTTTGAIVRSFTSFDNLEGSATTGSIIFSGGSAAPADTLPIEINYVTTNLSYYGTSGWAYLSLGAHLGSTVTTSNNTLAQCATLYAGVPALTFTLDADSTGANFIFNRTAHR